MTDTKLVPVPCKRCGWMPCKFVIRTDHGEEMGYGCVNQNCGRGDIDQRAIREWNEKNT